MPDLTRLRELICQYIPDEAEPPWRVPGLVVQGSKGVYVGPDVYEYNPRRTLVYAVNLPIAFRVTPASTSEPYLTFRLNLDPGRIAELRFPGRWGNGAGQLKF